MTTKTPWQQAREDAGLSAYQASIRMRDHLPERLCADPTRLNRFERGVANATLDVIAQGVLATIYGKNLREIDRNAADELDEITRTVERLRRRARRKYAPRDSNPEPAGMGAEMALGAGVTFDTAALDNSNSRAA